MSTLSQKVNDWSLNTADNTNYLDIHSYIEYMSSKRFHQYEPTQRPSFNFSKRLNIWLENVPSIDDQKIMFKNIPNIFYIGIDETNSLYITAHNQHIASWLVDQINLDIYNPNSKKLLEKAVSKTWFCPITESLRIDAFYHINGITGREYRPDWRTLAKADSKQFILDQISNEHIDRIVLLEDFVGSGSQMNDVLKFAVSFLSVPILVVPLVICSDGANVGMYYDATYPNIHFRPVITLDNKVLVRPTPTLDEQMYVNDMRMLAIKYKNEVRGNPPNSPEKYYSEFGFGDIGSMVVKYTNTPDNSLPLIHYTSVNWNPLFPRASRV